MLKTRALVHARALPRARLTNLFRRQLAALKRVRASPADLAWVASLLQPAELDLWRTLSGHDQHHSIEVARSVERRLLGTPYAGDGRWLGAALLHDIGKVVAGLSAAERVLGTLLGKLVAVSTAQGWADSAIRPKRRLGLYLTHGPAGAKAIRSVGGREEIASWAEVHQRLPCPDVSGVPGPVAHALSESDLE
jgi:hypothetical protein